MVSQKVKDLIYRFNMFHYSALEYLQLAYEEQEFLKIASEEDRDYYVQSGTGEGVYMVVSGILMDNPELALQFPDLDIKQYQPIVR